MVDAVEPHAVLSRLEAVLPLAARPEARDALQVGGREGAVVLDEQRRALESRPAVAEDGPAAAAAVRSGIEDEVNLGRAGIVGVLDQLPEVVKGEITSQI